MASKYGAVPVEKAGEEFPVSKYGAVPVSGASKYGAVRVGVPSEKEGNGSIVDQVLDPLREFAGGASFQFADELEAGVRSLVDRIPTEADRIADEINPDAEKKFRTAGEIHKEITGERDEWKAANPYAALGIEIAGALTTGGIVGRAVGLGGSMGTAAARQGGAAAIEGAVYGFGSQEEFQDRLKAAGYGMALGAPLGAAGGAVAQKFNPQYQRAKLVQAVGKMDDTELASVIEQRIAQRTLEMKVQGASAADIPSPVVMADEVARDLRIDPKRVKNIGGKNNGFNDYRDLPVEEMGEALKGRIFRSPEEAAKVAMREGNGLAATIDKGIAPIKRMIRNQVGERPAAFTNRALNRGIVQQADYHDNVMVPIGKVTNFLDDTANPDAVRLKGYILDGALGDEVAAANGRALISAVFGDDTAKAFDKFRDANLTWATRNAKSVNALHEVTKNWLHTQKIAAAPDAGLIRAAVSPNTAKDMSARLRTRKAFDGDAALINQYENPLRTMQDWVDDHAAVINFAEQFNLRPMGVTYQDIGEEASAAAWNAHKKLVKADRKAIALGERGGSIGRALRERMAQEDYDETSINNMVELTHSVLFDANRAPSAIVRAIRNLGYSGTIMNPYGAMMNLDDIFKGMTAMGVRNGVMSLFQKSELTTDQVGLAGQYAGEYIRKVGNLDPKGFQNWVKWTDKLAEKSGSWSGFRWLDGFGKNKLMQMSLNEARKEIKKGRFDERWAYTFTPDELRRLKSDLAAGETSDLVKELAMFRLSDLQPINAAQSTKFALNNPNARILYMLKGYAVRQLDFLRTNSIDEIRKGNYAKGTAFAMKYALIAGGGFSLVNETRQIAKWESPDYSPENLATQAGRQLASVATIGAAGIPDYSWDKFWADPPGEFAKGLIPPLNIPTAVWDDSVSLMKGEAPLEVLKNLPVVGKVFFEPLLDAE